MSSSVDGKVYVWDNSKAGEEQARHDYEDGPPEMVFPHETHMSAIEDIYWSPNDPYFAVSTETDGLIQIWKMS
jgi:histone-binding protein RBBP4